VRGRSSTLSASEEGAFHSKLSRWSSVYKDSPDAGLKETTYAGSSDTKVPWEYYKLSNHQAIFEIWFGGKLGYSGCRTCAVLM